MATELYLVRHGRTQFTQDRKYCGISDPDLSEDGLEQAGRLKRSSFLPDDDYAVIYSSPLKRAKETARVLYPDAEAIIEQPLIEMNFGEWEGLTSGQIAEINKDLYEKWINHPLEYVPPGGERIQEVNTRINGFLNKIITKHENKKIVLVSHAGPIKAMILLLLKKDLSEFWDIIIRTATVSHFKLTADKLMEYKLDQR